MAGGIIYLYAAGALACFALIFRLALAEYRRVDPADYETPWGDVIDPGALRRATEAADAYLEERAARAKLVGGTEHQGAGDRYATMAIALSHGDAV